MATISALAPRTQRASGPPPDVAGYERVWEEDFSRYASMSEVLRTRGNIDFRHGKGIWEPTEQFGNFDQRGMNGSAGGWRVNPTTYPWSGSFSPFSLDIVDGRRVLCMRAGTASGAGISAQIPYDPATSARYLLYASSLTTLNAVNFRGDFYYEVEFFAPDVYGAWWAVWLFSIAQGNFNANAPNFEIDVAEQNPIYPSFLQPNLHWDEDAVAGGTYQGSVTATDIGSRTAGRWQRVGVWKRGNAVTWYLFGRPFRTVARPPLALAWDDWMQVRMNLDLGSAAFSGFPGTWAGSPDPAKAYVKRMGLWMPEHSAGQNLRLNDIDKYPGLGSSRVYGLPSQAGGEPWFWGNNSATLSAGPTYNGVPSERIASTGADWNRMVGFGHNTSPVYNGEAGSVPALGGVINGKVYRTVHRFAYGTSAKAYFEVTADGGSLSGGNIAGTTYTHMYGPTFANISVTQPTDYPGETWITVDWTADLTSTMTWGFGPFSNTSGQYVDLIDVLIMPTS